MTAGTSYADELKLLGPDLTTSPSPSPSPSPAPGQQYTITLPVQADAWIDSLGAADSSGDTLWSGVHDYSSGGATEHTYLKFDISALAGKTIVDAKLRLWNTESYRVR